MARPVSREADEAASRPGRSASPQRCFKLLGPLGPTFGGHLTSPRPTHPSRPSSQQFTALPVLPGLLRPRFPARSSGSEWETGRGLHRELCSPTSSLGAAPQAVSTANSRKWAEGDRISGAGGGAGCGCARGRGRLRGFLELRRPWGFSPEARRGSQGASRAAPGKSGLHACGEGVLVVPREKTPTGAAARGNP